jgi:hypothetical protein
MKILSEKRIQIKDSLEKLAKRKENRLLNQDLLCFYQNLGVSATWR